MNALFSPGAENSSKLLLFLGPMSLMLVINLFMFAKALAVLLKHHENQREKERLNIRRAEKRSERMDKYLTNTL